MKAARHRDFGWLAVALVLVVVLGSGSRLIYLSSQRSAAVARQQATLTAAALAATIEARLRTLAEFALRSQHPQAELPPATGHAASRTADIHVLLMSREHTLLESPAGTSETSRGIVSEWAASEAVRPAPAAATLGPIRLGSQWLLAMRAPLGHPTPTAGWAVAYADLNDLVGAAHVKRLVDLGYDFELTQIEPRAAQARVFIGSRNEPLSDTVGARIRLPFGQSPATAGSYLWLALRPHAGWFPPTQLAADIGLLVFVAWLLAFAIHDLIHALQRSRAAVGAARRRLRSVNRQLSTEMQRRLKLQETFDYSRFHDAFTGLPNRRFFMDRLDRELRELRTRRRERIAVLLLDIARFKVINDLLGHTAGDELMVQAARRFETAVAGSESILARWSGDQFALLVLEGAWQEAALKLATALQAALRAPFELRRQRVVVSAAVGFTSIDSGQQRAEDVIREADVALSVAKRQEAGKIAAYSSAMAAQEASLVSLEADLHVALEKRELRLLFQPVVDLNTYRMVGAEALLRWRHPVESTLAPDRFLQIAEDAGLMVPITRWVIQRVAHLLAEWRTRLPADHNVYISINLSPTALRDPGLRNHVAAVLQETRIPPGSLKFELTEAAIISNVGAARETLDRLHAMGIQLMLDDFGTGYSSLSHLQLFPFDYVKIERPFVNRNQSDQANTGMMAALVQMAASLKLTPIAELIETEAAVVALQAMGCEFGQGFYFSEPLEAELALQRLLSGRPFQPQRNAATTQEIEPLDMDDSPTIMIPAGSFEFPPER